MHIDVRSHFDFFDVDGLLLLARFGGLFLALKLEATVVEDLADGRDGVRRDLYEIEAFPFCKPYGLVDVEGAAVVALGVDQLNPGNADLLVDPWTFFRGRWWCSVRTTNGKLLLAVDNIDLCRSVPDGSGAASCWPRRTRRDGSVTVFRQDDQIDAPVCHKHAGGKTQVAIYFKI